ncbi:MAG: LysR family transcriptional regulator [Candidatus Nanopelagicales bacterium]
MTDGWAGVELRHLASLRALADEGSFSRAAEALGYTQSAVSQQIARLERLVGQRLVDRPGGPNPVSLTPAGLVLLRYAHAISAQLARAAADLAALAAGTAGTLRVGCFQSVGVRILPRVLSEFAAAYPQVTVRLTEAEDDGELLALLERGELDLTFVAYPMMTGPFTTVELLEDPYVVVVRPDSELARQGGPVALRQLTNVPLVTYAQMREVHSIENRLGRPELTKQIVFRSNDNGTILCLAAEGVGAAVVSWLSVDPYREGVRTLALSGVSPRIVGIAWHSEREPIAAAEAFVQLAQAVAAREQALAPARA